MLRRVRLACVLLSAFCAFASAQSHRTVTYYYTDHQGNVLAQTDENGAIIREVDYKPYGQGTLDGPTAGPAFTGHVFDEDSGLQYMQARYQDPSTGRFLSTDPVTTAAGNVFNFNRYAYANNNPVVNIDPDGRTVTCDQYSCIIDSHNRFEQIVDFATVGVIYTQRLIQNAMAPPPAIPVPQQSTPSDPTALPGGLVGTQDGKTRQQGGRVNSGPLDPAHGGTGNASKDFDKLTGGKSNPAPAEKGYPPGTQVGDNGISHRPGTDKSGPRIDIPANEGKPPETLHYPIPDTPTP